MNVFEPAAAASGNAEMSGNPGPGGSRPAAGDRDEPGSADAPTGGGPVAGVNAAPPAPTQGGPPAGAGVSTGPGVGSGASRPPGGGFGPRPGGFQGPRPGGDRRGPPQRPGDSRRINHQIRIRQIRVIDDEGKMLGILETADALALALHKGLDLVEIAPDQRPPVCRIMDYGKFKYEEKKKQQESKRKQHQVQIKEVRLRPSIAEHDIGVKVRQAREFLADGDKVVLCCLFRGRQMAHKEVGHQVINHVFDLLKDIAKIEVGTRMEGKRMTMMLAKK
jgi:translation initiation factor IF-3